MRQQKGRKRAGRQPVSTMPIAKAILAEDHPSNSVVKKQESGTPRVADVCPSIVDRAFIGHTRSARHGSRLGKERYLAAHDAPIIRRLAAAAASCRLIKTPCCVSRRAWAAAIRIEKAQTCRKSRHFLARLARQSAVERVRSVVHRWYCQALPGTGLSC